MRLHSALPLSTRTEGRMAAAAHGPVDVMVQLAPAPASVVAAKVGGAVRKQLAFSAQRARVLSLQRSVAAHFTATATRATTLFAVSAVYDGIAVRTDASRLAALAHLPGVVAVHRLTPKHLDDTVTVPLTKAVQLWRDVNGTTGAGVTIGVVDTGVDYTHADFGGAGTRAAYDAAKSAPPGTAWQTAKVAGGKDFAGDGYDPTAGLPGDPDTNVADETPQPDDNPLDCNGHGTHVAGTAAGYGVTAGGATYTGSYTDTATDIPTFESQFSIGPGMAPGATLYALKIFGCGPHGTSSDLISAALDWAAAPPTGAHPDGDPNAHLDVVNLSLGSGFSPPDDPDAVAANNATDAGVTVVAAGGNAGDLFNAGGAPGDASSVLAVAASDDTQDIVDGLQVDSPSGLTDSATTTGAWPAEQSTAYAWAARPAVQGVLARLGSDTFAAPSRSNDSDGCDPLSPADAAAIAGKVAFLYWTDNDAVRRCDSTTRADNVANAGAVGAVLAGDSDLFSADIAGDSSLPTMLTTATARDTLLPQLGNDVTVTLTNALHNQVVLAHPATQDEVAQFSARGTETTGNVKPDVSAPGVTVFSADSATGNQGVSMSGTSMATPHVAGEAALVLAAHPAWLTDAHTGDTGANKANVPLEVKAAIMNTATTPVTCSSAPSATPQCSSTPESPNRVGSGRIDAEAAAQTQVVAYDDASTTSATDASGGVSVSFGRVEVTSAAVVTQHRTVDVVNTGASAVPAYAASYVSSDDMPGVDISVAPETAATSIPAGGTQQFTVTLSVDPAQIQDRPDPTFDALPGQFGGRIERNFVADESGRLVFTSSGGPTLDVPAYAAPREVATMTAPAAVGFSSIGIGNLPLSGLDVEEPSNSSTVAPVFSTVDSMELQGVSGVLPACAGGATPPGCTDNSADRAADLRAVGGTSDVPWMVESGADPYDANAPALASFGIVTQQPWRTPSDVNEYDVMLDVNNDGLPDAVLYNTRVPNTDVFVAELDRLVQTRGGFVDGPMLDLELLNNTDPSHTDTYLFDSNVMTMSFAIRALETVGFDPAKSTRLSYWVDGVSSESGIVDTIGDPLRGQQPMSIDLAHPAIYASDNGGSKFPSGCSVFCDPILGADKAGENLQVVRTSSMVAADKPLGVLLIRHNNASGARASLISFATSVSGVLARATAPYGYRDPVTVTVTTSLGTATGSVSITEGTATLATGALTNGVGHLTLPVRAVGKHALVVRYSGDATHAASSHTLALTVVKAATTTVLGATASGGVFTFTATTKVVAPGSGVVAGTVSFYDNGVRFATVATKGIARATRRLSHGTHTITETYGGNTTLAGSRTSRSIGFFA